MGQDLNSSDTARIEWCISTLNGMKALGREAPLGDKWPDLVMVIAALKRVLEPNLPTPLGLETNTELWAVCYLHDWDPDGKIYPEVHSIHEHWKDAEEECRTRMSPGKYWVRRGRLAAPKTL